MHTTQTTKTTIPQEALFTNDSSDNASGWKSFSRGLLEFRIAKSYSSVPVKKNYLHNANKYFNDAINKIPDYTMAFGYRGKSHCILGNHKQAVKDLSAAIKISKNNYPDLFLYRAYSFMLLEKYDTALADLNQAIKLYGNYKTAYYLRGEVHFRSGNFIGAANDYYYTMTCENKKTAGDLPCADEKELRLKRGICYYKMKNYRMALLELEPLMNAETISDEIKYYAGCCYIKFDKLEAIEKGLKLLMEVKDAAGFENVNFELAKFFTNVPDYENAMTHIEKYLASTVGDHKALILRGYLHTKNGNLTAALKDLFAAKEICNNDEELYLHLGKVFLELGIKNKAIENLSQQKF